MSALKRVFFFILFLFAFSSFSTPTFAADVQPLNSTNYNDIIHSERTVSNLINDGIVFIAGYDPFGRPYYADTVNVNSQGMIEVNPVVTTKKSDGAIGMTSKFMASIYTNPPTSSVQYLADLGENMGVSPKNVYAQGVSGSGENVIRPILKLWQVMRNLAYLIFILIFVAAGVMIMLRQKLNPQTVIGLQQALPGLVVGLILVTFSYFISALLVDLTFVGTRLVAEVFNQSIANGAQNFYNPDEAYRNSNMFQMYGAAGTNIQGNAGAINETILSIFSMGGTTTNNTIPSILNGIVAAVIGGMIGTALGGPIGTLVGVGAGGATGVISGVATGPAAISILASTLISLVILVALMIQFFRLLFNLIGAYIQILVLTVFSPLIILYSSVPGKGGTLGYWIRGILANALIFPAVFAGFMLAGLILGLNSNDWGQGTLPLFGGLNVQMIRVLLAIGILMGLPSLADIIRGFFKVSGPQGFVNEATGGFRTGANVGQTLAVQGFQAGRAGVGAIRAAAAAAGI